jgi:hypothetical protein
MAVWRTPASNHGETLKRERLPSLQLSAEIFNGCLNSWKMSKREELTFQTDDD